MAKTIRIDEKKLTEVISYGLRKVLRPNDQFFLDINKIPIEDLKLGYKDLRLVPTSTYFGDRMSDVLPVLKEAFGDILPPDDVAKTLIEKYNLPKSFVVVREQFHKIYVYVVTALVGENEKKIEEDMAKVGYFLGQRRGPNTIDGMEYAVLQFEPECQRQNDVTEEVREKYKALYHWTPSYNVQSILNKGLIPDRKNSFFNYPNRVYLIQGDASNEYLYRMGHMLSFFNNDARNNAKYSLLEINVNKIPQKVRFFYDSNSEFGIYTENIIPANTIRVLNEFDFQTKNNKQN